MKTNHDIMEHIPFRQFLKTAFDRGDYATDDVIAFALPLFREVLALHEEGRVAPFEREEALLLTNDVLDIDESFAHAPTLKAGALSALFLRSSHLSIVGHLKLDTDVDSGHTQLDDLQLELNPNEPITRPVYLPGYGCYETKLGHHDNATDIFCLGLILGSMALGLDLYEKEDLETFVRQRTNPSRFREKIHPTLATLITEMTELDRRRRAQDLYDIIHRLEHYRDFDPEKNIDLSTVAGWKTKELSGRGQYILNKLRNRLFDNSRRNRLLYYKPNMRFVNLTVSSVPMVLHYQSIRPDWLFTWNEEIAGKVKGMKELVLNKYLRFEDHPYLVSSLDKIRTEARHDIQEYGFSQLKLVIAFLNWHNLKEEMEERIQSPLLLIPVELRKNKKLKEDHYLMKVLANEAEVNPVVANQLRELYGIKFPDFIDLDDTTLEAFYGKLKEQIDSANQGITLNYIDKPRIKLIHSVAKQTVTNFKKRQRRGVPGGESYKNIAYSYTPENFKPLGLEIFRQRIEPRASFLEFLVNDEVQISAHHLNGSAERELFQLVDSESNPYSWDFDVCNIVLGNFNYKKMSLVRDYNQVIDKNVHHEVFEELFSEKPRRERERERESGEDGETEIYQVIKADPTQAAAVMQGRTGESYIIQGPPGTGKSQTITNLIADFIGQGKTVLFVCEKRAALDVVFHRLKQQGLDELCCYIHDSQGDKREFIKNLKTTYEDFIKNRLDLQKIEDERLSLLQKISRHLSVLKNYHFTNVHLYEKAGTEVRRLIERLVELRGHFSSLSKSQEDLLPYYKDWKEFGETVEQLSTVLETSTGEPVFSEHPFSRLNDTLFLTESPAREITKRIESAQALLETIQSVYRDYGITQWDKLSEIKGLVEDAVLLYPLAESGNMGLVDPSHPEAREFEKAYSAHRQLEAQVKELEALNEGWQQKFSEAETRTALALAESKEGSFFSFLSGDFRRLKKAVQGAYNMSRHQLKPKYAVLLRQLLDEYEAKNKARASLQDLENGYHLPHLDTAWLGLQRIRTKLADPEVDFLLHHPDAVNLVKRIYKLNTPYFQLEALLQELLHEGTAQTLNGLQDSLDSLSANLDSLPELLPALRQYAAASPELKKAMRSLPLEPVKLEAATAGKTLKQVYLHQKEFEGLDGAAIEAAVDEIKKAFGQLLKYNAALIRARIRQKFIEHLEISNMALSQLNGEQRAFKKAYTEGRKTLENEFGKSMRYKSIRELAGKESGLVLKDLKPVWLMSPLSVSDSLPLDQQYFDVVIFDEASQITLEEGIPSLYRAPQTIIVGDDKQMPPTNFFSSRAEDPDDLEGLVEEEDEILSQDADSLLVQGSRKLSSVMLGWHYRSRYETLISYSNHAFYEGDLLTIPDRTIHHGTKQAIEVSSAQEAVAMVHTLFDRSMSFHFHTNSVYEKRSNLQEAAYIAQLVRELLKRKVEESIGIVAFSQEQQGMIETALETLAAEDKEFETLLEEAYNRTEEDQYVGLIVKNLENIQGDERDIIIMSVCYGPDARKKMLMNFGPINKKGGEKRLNVLFSRAKKHMAVVSSIKHHYITNEYNEGASYFRRFLHYAEEVSAGNMATARTILDSLVLRKPKKYTEDLPAVTSQLKEALEKEGYEVAEEVGQSSFKCSLAIKTKGESDVYSLGILVDDQTHYENENLLEQYYQRPSILKDFGWKTITVFTKDWLHHPKQVLEVIRKRMTDPGQSDIAEDNSLDSDKIIIGSKPVPEPLSPPKTSGLYDHLAFERLEFTDDISSKFWEVATDETKVITRFGRIGTKGQTIVKTFESVARARSEAGEMIAEKLGKGYRKV